MARPQCAGRSGAVTPNKAWSVHHLNGAPGSRLASAAGPGVGGGPGPPPEDFPNLAGTRPPGTLTAPAASVPGESLFFWPLCNGHSGAIVLPMPATTPKKPHTYVCPTVRELPAPTAPATGSAW